MVENVFKYRTCTLLEHFHFMVPYTSTILCFFNPLIDLTATLQIKIFHTKRLISI